MSKNEWKKWVSVVGRMLLAYALVFAQGAWARQTQGTKDKAASPQKAAAQQANEKRPSVATSAKAQTKQAQGEESESAVAEEKSRGDGSHEGIKVHGHWTIEVRNSDGTLATHREFENSLQTSGGAFLANLLSNLNNPFGGATANWFVVMGQNLTTVNPSSAGPCGTAGAICVISQNKVSYLSAFNNITVPAIGQLSVSSNGGALTLSGSVNEINASNGTILTSNGTIGTVLTGVGTFNPPNLIGTSQSIITQFDLSNNPVNVIAGQAIAVTVVITFS